MEQSQLSLAMEMSLFAYLLMAAIAMLCAVFIRGIVLILARQQKAVAKPTGATPVVVSVTPARDQNAEIAAAIAAAVFAVLGAHRLVYIGEAKPTFGWTGEIRSRLHTSHTPRHDHH